MAINVGDVYFVGYFGQGTASGSNTSPEGFAILIKNTLAAGEVLSFTDAALQANGTFATNEQTINFPVPAGGIAANTVLEFPLSGANTTTVYANNGNSAGGRDAIGTITPTGATGLNNSGDQVFAFQGTLAQPTVLAGVDVADNSPITTGATSTTTTYAPTNGAPFLNLPKGSNNAQIAMDPTTATPAQLTDAANYTQNIPTSTNPETSFASIACYVTGTQIRTSRGGQIADIAVEALRVGDLVVTASGAHRPVRWLGHQTYRPKGAMRPRSLWPVRVAAGAFGDEKPSSDLLLSPGHSVCLGLIDEVLVPIQELVNGSTIAYAEVNEVTYWHVELESHDLLIANGLAAESFLEMGNNRTLFENGRGLGDPSPDAVGRTHANFCRRFVDAGPLLATMRDELTLRAKKLGWMPDQSVTIACVADGRASKPLIERGTALFAVAAGTELHLVTDMMQPHLHGDADHRTIGVAIYAIKVVSAAGEERALDLDDPSVASCFHAGERDSRLHYRWSAGDIVLPASFTDGLDGPLLLCVDFEPSTVRGWTSLPAVAERPKLRIVG